MLFNKQILTILLVAMVQAWAQAQSTLPLVAVHDSELTRALETMPAVPPTPTGPGDTGFQWWQTDWHYFVGPESMKEVLRSEGTAFTVIGDSNITSGLVLSNGTPKYPIVISLASEAVRNDEIGPLTNYVAAGGFLLVGSSAFTRNTNGTTRGDFAFANQLGVHMVNANLNNWLLNGTFMKTNQPNHTLVSAIPNGQLTWAIAAYAEEIPDGISPNHGGTSGWHDVWEVQAGDATMLAMGTTYPILFIKPFGKGYFIYISQFQPLISHGGAGPGMYAYLIFRRAIEWAFQSANLPIPKVSPWPYPYDAAFMVRHDLENFTNEIADIRYSAGFEWTNGAKGDYYFCTGTLREDAPRTMTNAMVTNLQYAVSRFGATIGPHNGGLKNPNNPNLVRGDYDYWHWGPDEALDVTPKGYASGQAYALTSVSNSFKDIESWVPNQTNGLRVWVAPFYNATREKSYAIESQLGVKITGEQKLSPFPAWTLSTQNSTNPRYGFLSEPLSDWYVNGLIAPELEVQNSDALHAGVDFFYNMGFLINFYSHTLSTGEGPAGSLASDYVTYGMNSSLHPRLWSANAVSVYQWWLQRSNVQMTASVATNGAQSIVTCSIANAVNTNSAIELVVPGTNSCCNLQVLTNGVLAGTNVYRLNGQVIKVRVGTSVTNAVISYYPQTSFVVFAENFDSVPPPNLPAGWTTSAGGAESVWTTVNSSSDTPPNAVFSPDTTAVGSNALVSPSIALPASGETQLSFQQSYDLEPGSGSTGNDGGVLEIKIGSNPFTDIVAAGGSFVSGGYNAVIGSNNPLLGRSAWSGNSGGFISTVVNLPPSASGQAVQLRWRCATDTGTGFTGWWIDTVTIVNQTCLCCANNYPPAFPFEPDVTTPELTPLTVVNTAFDPNLPAQTLAYTLLTAPANATISANGVITWTPQQTQSPSTNTFTTRVTDAGSPPLSATNSFVVVVQEVNQLPVLSQIAAQAVNEMTQLVVTNTASEPNIHSVTLGYGLLSAPSGASIDINGVVSWTPQQSQSPGTNLITTMVTNSNPYDTVNPQLIATNSFTVIVSEVNLPPVFSQIATQTASELTQLMVTNTATEPNIHSVTLGYGLSGPLGASIDINGVITWTPSQNQSPGTYLLTTIVTNSNPYDSVNPQLTATNSFTVIVSEVNLPPVLSQIATQTVSELSQLVVTNAASEPSMHSATLGYGLQSAPFGASIDINGVIRWTPQQSQSPSTNLISTVVTNSNPYDSANPQLTATNSFTVIVSEVNLPPALSQIATQTVSELTQLVLTNAASEPNIHSATLGYGLLSAPSGASIDINGVIRWTPQQSQSPATNLITTVVTNSNPYDSVNPQLTATNSFTVVVNEVNLPPALSQIETQSVNELTPLVVTNAATEPNIHSVTLGYGLTSANIHSANLGSGPSGPLGASIDTNGVITWTPSQQQSPGTYVLTTVVTNSNPYDSANPQLTATNSFAVIVGEVNQPPVLSQIEAQSVNELTLLLVTNTASEPNIHSATLGYGLTGPAGASIDTNGVITWTPSEEQSPGTYVLTTVVTNSNPYDSVNPQLTATNSFTVMVNEENQPPILNQIATQTVNELTLLVVTNTAIEQDIHATTLGYGLTGPPGASIDMNGIITWTPSKVQSPGTYVLTTAVTNSNPYDVVNPHMTATNSFTVVVVPLPAPPLLSISTTEAGVLLSWNSEVDAVYRLQFKDDIADLHWNDASNDVVATGTQTTLPVSTSSTAQQFYRIVRVR
jgi:hypothetical protein